MIEFHPLARDELQVALAWYREKSARTAVRFLQRIDESLRRLIVDPSSYPNAATPTHKAANTMVMA